MSWCYDISSGNMYAPDGTIAGRGYSGNGEWKNQISAEGVKDHGPIPQGWYTMGTAIDSPQLGSIAIPLIPDPENNMQGRSGFFCHGDSILHPGDASDGCCIQPHDTRVEMNSSTDRRFEAVAHIEIQSSTDEADLGV
jgi:Protein of unknown function (DUF2778)